MLPVLREASAALAHSQGSSPSPPRPTILAVGEGDFSFAAASTEALGPRAGEVLVATERACRSSVTSGLSRAATNLGLLESAGVHTRFGVCARALDDNIAHFEPFFSARGLDHMYFDAVVYNFPSTENSTWCRQRENRDLLRDFLMSAKEVLNDEGKVYVTMRECQAHYGGWQLEARCAEAGLWVSTSIPVSHDLSSICPGYTTTRGVGLDVDIPTEDSRTYVITRGCGLSPSERMWKDNLVAYLTEHGEVNMGVLGEACKRPLLCPKLGEFLKRNPGTFDITGTGPEGIVSLW